MTEEALGFETESLEPAPDEKEPQKHALVRLGSEATLWHDPDHRGFATFETKGHKENHLLRSKSFKAWLRYRFYLETEKAPGSQAMEDALGVLEARAMFLGEGRETYVRIAQVDRHIYIDLGSEDWSAVEVSFKGWRIITDPPVAFVRSRSMRAAETRMRRRSRRGIDSRAAIAGQHPI